VFEHCGFRLSEHFMPQSPFLSRRLEIRMASSSDMFGSRLSRQRLTVDLFTPATLAIFVVPSSAIWLCNQLSIRPPLCCVLLNSPFVILPLVLFGMAASQAALLFGGGKIEGRSGRNSYALISPFTAATRSGTCTGEILFFPFSQSQIVDCALPHRLANSF
jgi:hypothetical protein